METRYMEDKEFVAYVQSLPAERTEIVAIDGKNRWQIVGDDGVKYILRPESSRKV